MGWRGRARNEAAGVKTMRAVMVAAVLLTGCDRGIALRDATPRQVAQAMSAAPVQRPGQWHTRTSVEAIDTGRVSSDFLREQQAVRTIEASGCVTAADAVVPGFGRWRGGACRFDRFVLKHGQLDAALHCVRGATRVAITQAGRYDPTGYDLVTTVRQLGVRGAPTTMAMRIAGVRVGDCHAAEPRVPG